MIRAPFNFVPRSQFVFFPSWSGKVGMDVPFENAQTGKIHLRLTAKTPVFVRQGQVTNATPSKDFVHKEDVYFIPATSIKGMVRSILEIISFGKLSMQGDKESKYLAHAASTIDLAECIFGKVKGDSMRGRVQFSHAELKSSFTPTKEEEAYCGQPKASYDPIYKDGSYLKGWKRYPVRSEVSEIPEVAEGNEEFAQHFIPLAAGSVFECDMRYFNLKREELGALLYAMNFFEGAIYSIGFGKPYGFGQVTIELSGNEEIEILKQEFVSLISNTIEGYTDSVQLHELKEMMTLHPEKEHFLEYMSLAEYNEHREDGSSFPYYSQLESAIIEEKEEETENQEEQTPPNEPAPVVAQTPQEPEPILAKVTFFQKQGNNMNVSIVIEDGDKKGRKEKITVPINVNTKNIKWNKVKQVKVGYRNGKFIFIEAL